MNMKSVTLTGAVVTLIFYGCSTKEARTDQEVRASSETKTLEERIAAEPPANSPNEIAARASQAFANARGLSDDQRRRLAAIYLRTYSDALSIRTEIGKSKSLLFKMISQSAHDSKEVQKLKSKIVELDQRRLTLMFKALEDVQAVVGYGKGKDEIYRHFYDYEYPRHGNLSRN